jgi:hypothetical protein
MRNFLQLDWTMAHDICFAAEKSMKQNFSAWSCELLTNYKFWPTFVLRITCFLSHTGNSDVFFCSLVLTLQRLSFLYRLCLLLSPSFPTSDYKHFLFPLFARFTSSDSPFSFPSLPSVQTLLIHGGKFCWCFVPFHIFFFLFSVSNSIIHSTMKIHHSELFCSLLGWLSPRAAPIHDGSLLALQQNTAYTYNVLGIFLVLVNFKYLWDSFREEKISTTLR